MKILFICNPRAGRLAGGEAMVRRIRQRIAAYGGAGEVTLTESRGHAVALARAAAEAGYERVVAVGGDGTLNEVAQGLLGGECALALVPCGSGNGLARHLRMPTHPQRAIDWALDPRSPVRAIDTGEVGGRVFVNVMGLGLDAEIGRRFNQVKRRGLPAYVRATVAALREARTLQLRGTLPGTAIIVAVANSDQYGNNARIAPGARVDDGLLDLIVVRPGSLASSALLAWRLFNGTFDRSPRVSRARAARFNLERESSGLLHTDGETYAVGANLEVSVRAGSLRVVAPA